MFIHLTIIWRVFSVSVSQSVQLLSRVDYLQHHELQHARPPIITNSRSLPKLMSIELVMPSSHLILCRPLLLLPPIFPSIRVFSNQSTLASAGQSIGVSASASVLPMNTQDWSPLGWTGWISLKFKGLSRVFSSNTLQKHQFFQRLAFFRVQHSHPYMTTGKTIALSRQTFVGKVMSLLFNILSRLVITFLPRSKHLLISRLQSPSVILLGTI